MMTPSMLHNEGYCGNDCEHPEHDLEYTVTVSITVRAPTDEDALEQVEDVLRDGGLDIDQDVEFLVLRANGARATHTTHHKE